LKNPLRRRKEFRRKKFGEDVRLDRIPHGWRLVLGMGAGENRFRQPGRYRLGPVGRRGVGYGFFRRFGGRFKQRHRSAAGMVF
jgi:hypothetical protein